MTTLNDAIQAALRTAIEAEHHAFSVFASVHGYVHARNGKRCDKRDSDAIKEACGAFNAWQKADMGLNTRLNVKFWTATNPDHLNVEYRFFLCEGHTALKFDLAWFDANNEYAAKGATRIAALQKTSANLDNLQIEAHLAALASAANNLTSAIETAGEGSWVINQTIEKQLRRTLNVLPTVSLR